MKKLLISLGVLCMLCSNSGALEMVVTWEGENDSMFRIFPEATGHHFASLNPEKREEAESWYMEGILVGMAYATVAMLDTCTCLNVPRELTVQRDLYRELIRLHNEKARYSDSSDLLYLNAYGGPYRFPLVELWPEK